MKKILLLIALLFVSPAFANEAWEEDDGLQYTVLKTTFDYTPLREAPSTNAQRYTHLRKGVSIYAEEYDSNFYILDFGTSKRYWVEKKYVTPVDKVVEKRGTKLSKIKIYDDKENYFVKIKTKTKMQTPYKIAQNGNELGFQMYDIDLKKNKKRKQKNKDKYGINIKSSKIDGFDVFMMKPKINSGVLTLNYKSRVPIFGYDVKRKDNALILQIRKPIDIKSKKPLKGVKIALDAGHGGSEPGCVSRGVKEKDVNLQITKKLNKELKKRGAKTYLTRKKDVDVSLYKRVETAKKAKADFLISIHQNSLANPENYEKKHGAGVYYYNENAKALAESVQTHLVRATGFKDDGVFNSSLALTRTTDPVRILVECGYLIHPYERVKLTDEEFQATVAEGIANGVEKHLRYLKNHQYKRLKYSRREAL